MAYTQLKKFSQAKAGKTKNFCLANVTQGYGIPNKYGSAWEAWQHTEQHENGAPLGVDVPVYFSYTATIDGINKNWGHIGVRLANGKFWSDGMVYPSVGVYTAGHSPKYVGWGESVNGVKVIKEQDVKMSRGDVIWAHQLVRRPTTEAKIRALTGTDFDKWAKSVINSSWFKADTAKINGSSDGKFKQLAQKVKDLIPFTK